MQPTKSKAGQPTTDNYGHWLGTIARTPLLTAEDEVRLAKRMEAGLYAEHLLTNGSDQSDRKQALRIIAREGRSAKNQMIQANLRLVVSIVKRCRPTRTEAMELSDLVQEGNIGLIRAVELFDYTKGFKFSTYATWWIKSVIDRGITNQERTIRLPLKVSDTLARIDSALREANRQGRSINTQELMAAADVPEEQFSFLMTMRGPLASLDRPVADGELTTLGDLIEDRPEFQTQTIALGAALRSDMRAAVRRLSDRERSVVVLMYGLIDDVPLSLRQTSEQLGLTLGQVRSLKNEAFARLRRQDALAEWAA